MATTPATKATKNDKTDRKPVLVQFRPETHDFLTKIANGVSLSKFAREAAIKAAEKLSGKPAPAVTDFGHGGRSTVVSIAAKKLGLSTAEYKNKLVAEALGLKFEPKTPKVKLAKVASK